MAVTAPLTWEKTFSMYHHCGKCGLTLSNPRSKGCIGEHLEPCCQFHPLLHFIQKSHECHACGHLLEARFERCKEIAKIVREFKAIDAEILANHPSSQRKKPRHSQNMMLPETDNAFGANNSSRRGYDPRSTSYAHGGSASIIKKRDRKIAKRLSSHSERVETAEFKCQVFRNDEIEFVEIALHPKRSSASSSSSTPFTGFGNSNNALVDQETFAANISFNPMNRHHLRKEYKRRSYESAARKEPAMSSARLNEILAALQVTKKNALGETPKRKALLKLLVEKITEDAEITAADNEYKREREAAFWRHATKASARKMQENHSQFSWATGDNFKTRNWRARAAAAAAAAEAAEDEAQRNVENGYIQYAGEHDEDNENAMAVDHTSEDDMNEEDNGEIDEDDDDFMSVVTTMTIGSYISAANDFTI